MAIVAVHLGVLASQPVAGLIVIERFPVRLPADQWEIWAGVLTMTFRTVIAGASARQPHGVHSAAPCHALADLGVALHAAEFLDPEFQVVTLVAIQGTGQRLVCLRKLARRELGVSFSRKQYDKKKACQHIPNEPEKSGRPLYLARSRTNPRIQIPPRSLPTPLRRICALTSWMPFFGRGSQGRNY